MEIKLTRKNFNGSVKADYLIKVMRPADTPFAIVNLYLALPGNRGYQFYDCSSGTQNITYTENLRNALILAEEMWGLELVGIKMGEKINPDS